MIGSVLELAKAAGRAHVGGKARGLARLRRLGLTVPTAWVVPASVLRELNGDSGRLQTHILRNLEADQLYAVRSSAEGEDSGNRSYAGRFLSLLDVPAASVPEAVLRVAASAHSPDSMPYASSTPATPLAMSVIIQRMVRPDVAGVVFSRNPVTGIRETVIEAATGTAQELVSGRVQPQRWVRKHAEWVLAPDAPLLPESVTLDIAQGVERIESSFGYPVDAEWAWDGTLWWLQARPMTTGRQAAVYSSKMARDMLPGVIVPLVWSVNGPLMGEVFIRFLEDVFGPLDIEPDDLATLIHHRVYINIGSLSRLFAEFGLPEESLEMLAGMEKGAGMPGMPRPTLRGLSRFPHMARSAFRLSRFDSHLEQTLPGLWERSKAFLAECDPGTLSADDVLVRMDSLRGLVQEVAYRHLITLMLMQMYTMRFRKKLQKKGLLGEGDPLDLVSPGDSPFSLGSALQALAESAAGHDETVLAMLRSGDFDGLRKLNDAAGLIADIDRFLADFGHFSDSGVNFSAAQWSEEPHTILRMIAARVDSARDTAGRADVLRNRSDVGRHGRAARRAATYLTLRDQTSSLYTHAYGQFRRHALALGAQLHDREALADAGDVFFLTIDEIRRVVSGELLPHEARAITRERSEEIAAAAEGEPPEVVVGDVAELIHLPGRRVFRGVPSSRGRYTGRAVICRSIADLDRIAHGDVVVVPHSDASWTPLFLRAGAIVAESGGLLSHSAILSRELGVPSIVSVRGALVISDGTLVSVDGFEGTVTILETA